MCKRNSANGCGQPAWIDEALLGNRAAFARLLTAIENQRRELPTILSAVSRRLGRAQIIGVTGAPGVGKSTLIGGFVKALRQRDMSVAVLAVDPSSTFTGGAVLGDRVRMAELQHDPGIFIRSLATRGHLGGLTATATMIVDACDAAGWDVVIVETVGVGQAEIDIAGLAHETVVVCAPGLGDVVQGIKAGIMEIADVLVLNKADLPNADLAGRQLLQAIEYMPESKRPALVHTAAKTNSGITVLADLVIERHAGTSASNATERRRRVRRLLTAFALQRLRDRLDDSGSEAFDSICEQVLDAGLDFETAAAKTLALGACRT
jgi:LAO/AO transport system kinase